jgi:2'-5' RNA ligase
MASLASTQFNLPPALADHVRRAAAKIPDWALVDKGRETEPHVTVKYGLHSDDPSTVRGIVSRHPQFDIRMGRTSHFPDSGHGDVVKAEVDSPQLHELHHAISNGTENTSTFPDFKPHVTLAYVKKGMGRHLAEKDGDSLAGKSARVDHVMFSDKNEKKTRIPLKASQSDMIARLRRQ